MLASGRDRGLVLRHRLFLILGLAAAACCLPAVSPATDVPPLRGASQPFFTTDFAVSPDGDGRPVLSVSVAVPYPELQWIALPQGYEAGAEITVSFLPGSGRERVYGGTWERRLFVPDFSMTVLASSAIVHSRSFAVPPGRYTVRVSVRDLNADVSSSASERLEVPDYSQVPVGFSDLELGTSDSTGHFALVPARVYGFDVSRLAARVSLFDRRPGSWPRSYPFRYRVLDEYGLEVLSGAEQVMLARSAQPVVVRPAGSDLFLGSYVFEVTLVQGRSHWRADRSFDVEQSGPPRGKDFARVLEVLSYIAETKEIEHLRSLTPEQQAAGWEQFWRKRDPAPGTGPNEALVEFFRRVRYAGHRFQGFGPGWRSDMGRIYIKYGAPERVETVPPALGAISVEVWYYSHPHRRFVFEDRDGFGRFVLTSPAFE
jgi:GWxTD domain-containing protein